METLDMAAIHVGFIQQAPNIVTLPNNLRQRNLVPVVAFVVHAWSPMSRSSGSSLSKRRQLLVGDVQQLQPSLPKWDVARKSVANEGRYLSLFATNSKCQKCRNAFQKKRCTFFPQLVGKYAAHRCTSELHCQDWAHTSAFKKAKSFGGMHCIFAKLPNSKHLQETICISSSMCWETTSALKTMWQTRRNTKHVTVTALINHDSSAKHQARHCDCSY